MEDSSRLLKIWHRLLERIRRQPLIFILLSLIIATYVLPLFGGYGSLLSPQIYPKLAPEGWRNITPHGNVVLFSYATSVDEPGLMLACGSLFTITWNDPATWRFGEMHDWLSRDGGKTWKLLDTPFDLGDYCTVALPYGQRGTLVEAVVHGDITRPSPAAVWVSHDEGRTWAQRPTIGYAENINSWIYRHGALYGYFTDAATSNSYFARSADDGVTWTALPGVPDTLVGGDDLYEAYVPDFRQAYAWYGELTHDGQPPVLIASQDDGATWTKVAQMPAPRAVVLATSPLAPDHICASSATDKPALVRVLAGSDGGTSWHVGVLPSSIPTTGFAETALPPAIDREGNCYLGLHYGNSGDKTSHYAFLQQSPERDGALLIPIANSVSESGDTLVVPDGEHARLVFESFQEGGQGQWAYVLSDLASETNDGVLMSRAVP